VHFSSVVSSICGVVRLYIALLSFFSLFFMPLQRYFLLLLTVEDHIACVSLSQSNINEQIYILNLIFGLLSVLSNLAVLYPK
jgi:hypothetical protein